MGAKTYPAYRDSGVEWIGEIPEHWEVKRLKDVVNFWMGYPFPSDELGEVGTPVIRMSDIRYERVVLDSAKRVPYVDKYERFSLRENDIVYGMSGSVGNVGKVGAEALPCLLNQRVACVRETKRISFEYAWFYLISEVFTEQILDSATGTAQINVSPSSFNSSFIPSPPLEEQKQIASFLDRETSKIDTLIGKQQQLINLLKEKRGSLISHTVTKGLNSNGPMKDSGVEWIGEIPEHWEVKALRKLLSCRLANGYFVSKDNKDGDVPLINVSDIYTSDNKVHKQSLERVGCPPQDLARYQTVVNDLFAVRSSIKTDGVGAVCQASDIETLTIFECHLIRIRLNHNSYSADFYRNCFASSIIRASIISQAKVTTMATLPQEAFLSLAVPTPPLEEQKQIASFLDRETSKIDTLIDKAKQSIALLKERRSSLISSAVTGKIDVREAA